MSQASRINSRWRQLRCSSVALAFLAFSGVVGLNAAERRHSTAPIQASKTEAAEPVAALQRRLDRGETPLAYHPQFGYLLSILEELRIPPMSQLLVFSKTSCQRDKISPKTPRAIYFNDRAYVAWIPNSPLLEVSGSDPKLGAVFYTLDQKEDQRPKLVRRDQCLECHTSTRTLGIPGYLVRSYATDGNGVIDITDGCSMVDHRTPLAERWGGWYICGTAGTSVHRGKSIGDAAALGRPESPSLDSLVDLSAYIQPTSDLVALMVLEHQAHMQNLITQLGHASRQNEGAGADKGLSDTLLRYLLFTEEAALSRPIAGVPGFISWFQEQGPFDKQGRSLRQFDLEKRLFKFPCSYMIYSDAFNALPRSAQLHLYHRLWKILNGEDPDPAFSAIPVATRRAVLEILIATKSDVPIYWKL